MERGEVWRYHVGMSYCHITSCVNFHALSEKPERKAVFHQRWMWNSAKKILTFLLWFSGLGWDSKVCSTRCVNQPKHRVWRAEIYQTVYLITEGNSAQVRIVTRLKSLHWALHRLDSQYIFCYLLLLSMVTNWICKFYAPFVFKSQELPFLHDTV